MADQKLKKNLSLFDVFVFGIGPMLSVGIFLLPGMVYAKVGPAAILAYAIAGILIIPPLMSKAELATAMPRAGGTYYFLDRSMGPLVGTIAGIGTWLALAFKSSFALIGLGAYLVFFLDLAVKPVALALCVIFGGLNVSGVKNVGRIQAMFVSILLGILAYFIGRGLFQVDMMQFEPFFTSDLNSLLGAVGFVFVSFTGLTKIASMAEEVEDLERNIPLGMMLALGVSLIIYILCITVIIGVIPGGDLAKTLTPMVDAVEQFMGPVGKFVMAGAGILAFAATANVGMSASSRYPLAMSRDNIFPDYWKKVGRFHTPTRSIVLTTLLMLVFILLLTPEGVAKLASVLKLLIFGIVNLAVIVMRESKITAYDPGFRSFGYPWVQIIGLITPLILIPAMGTLAMIFSAGVVLTGILWYLFYAEKRVQRSAAMYQVFQRLGSAADKEIHNELRQLMREKGLRKEDQFEEVIVRAGIMWADEDTDQSELIKKASRKIAKQANIQAKKVYKRLLTEIQDEVTPFGQYIALPHVRLEGVQNPELVIVHSREGIQLSEGEDPVYAIFILVSPREDPQRHLRFLSELANRAENIDFEDAWRQLDSERTIRNSFLRTGNVTEYVVESENIAGQPLRNFKIHEDCLVAMISRNGDMIMPHGDTNLKLGDRLTLIGKQEAVDETINYFERKT